MSTATTVIGTRSERPLDGAHKHSFYGPPPGWTSWTGHVHRAPRVSTAVWVRYGSWWREGWVVDSLKMVNIFASGTSRVATVEVEYVPDRTGRLLVHRFPVSEIRTRETS